MDNVLSTTRSYIRSSVESVHAPVIGTIDSNCPTECICHVSEGKVLSVRNCTITLRHQLTDLLDIFPNLIQLDISLSKVSLIQEVLKLTQLTSLHLQVDNMMSMPCELSGLTKLTLLDLSHNDIESVSCDLSNLSHLTTLDLSHNALMSMPCDLTDLTKLTLLDMSHNDIESVSCDLSNLSQLTTLDLFYNGLESMPCELSVLKQLSSLNLSDNYIELFPCDFSNLTELRFLDLSFNLLHSVPCNMSTLTNLLSLNLHGNIIRSVPYDLSNLNKLISVNLSDNQLKSVPCKISALTKLTTLDLSDNEMNSDDPLTLDTPSLLDYFRNLGPCNLTTLDQLTFLDLSNNMMRSLPSEVLTLSKLTTLILTSNMIYSDGQYTLHSGLLNNDNMYSGRYNLSALRKLTFIDLSKNSLRSVPCDLSNLTSLDYLDLSNNVIKAFTCDFPDLIQLTTLDLSDNKLSSVPCELSKLSNLTFLDLSFNDIDSASCGLSTSLIRLDLSYNIIDSFTLDLSNLTQLSFLDLRFNSIKSVDSWPLSLANGNSFITTYLGHNMLSEFTNNAGAPVTECSSNNLKSISLVHNRIKHFTDILTGWNINISTPELLHSCLDILEPDMALAPLTCDCVDYEVYRYFQNRSTYNDQLVCDQPPHLRNRNIMSINLDQFICDMDIESCPQGCLCKNNPYYRSINVTCKKDYKGDTLPTTLPELPSEEYSYCLDFQDTHIDRIKWTSYLAKVKVAKFSFNFISEISIEALWDLQNVSTLYLDNNKLHRLPENITAIRFNRLSEIRLGKNPWDCDCAATETIHWMILHKNVIKDRHIQCNSPPHMLRENMINNTINLLCPHNKNKTNNVMIGSISGTIVVLVCILITIVIKIRKWLHNRKLKQRMNHIDDAEDREFDVFISFASEDEDYIVDTLMPELENHNYKVCFHRIHFLGGFTLSDNIFQCINNSRRTLVYFSNFYKNSNCCMWEFNEALNKDIQEGTKCLITIKDTDLDTENMDGSLKAYFQRRTHIERDGPKFWENLLYSLPKRHAGAEVFEIQED